jgi:hypothetical protein
MSAMDLAVGYPVHAVATYRVWSNSHGVQFVDWTAACSASGTESGSGLGVFRPAGSARRAELCEKCWPNAWSTPHEPPREVSE